MNDRKPKRQGDIRFVPVDSQSHKGRVYNRRKRGQGLIVAAGEMTGHHHRVRDSHTRMFEQDGKEFLTVSRNGAQLEHEEHAPIALEPGTYQIQRQRELALRPLRENQVRQTTDSWATTNVWD